MATSSPTTAFKPGAPLPAAAPAAPAATTSAAGGLPAWAISVIVIGAVIGALIIAALLAGATIAAMWFFGTYASYVDRFCIIKFIFLFTNILYFSCENNYYLLFDAAVALPLPQSPQLS